MLALSWLPPFLCVLFNTCGTLPRIFWVCLFSSVKPLWKCPQRCVSQVIPNLDRLAMKNNGDTVQMNIIHSKSNHISIIPTPKGKLYAVGGTFSVCSF